jgi:hypothetical protein
VEVFTIFDTGTSFTLLPPSYATAFFDTLVASAGLEEGAY